MPNIGIPEVIIAMLLIFLPVLAARRFPIPEKVFPNGALIAVGVILLVLLFNYATTFRTVH